MVISKHCRTLLFFLALLIAVAPVCIAQDAISSPVESNSRQKIKSLQAIQHSLKNVTGSIRRKQNQLDSTEGLGRQESIRNEIQNLDAQRRSLERNFSEIASGVDVSTFGTTREKIEVNWQKEVQVLLGPLLNEVKRLTSGPREMAFYRTQIDELEEKYLLTTRALSNIAAFESTSTELKPLLASGLAEEQQRWTDRELEVRTQLEIVRQKLNQKLQERTSVVESVKSIPELFFKSRGRNLLIAFFITVLFCLFLRKIQNRITATMEERGKNQSFRYRLFNVAYLFFTGIGSLLVFLTVLFFFGDWVLLILGAMFLLGLVWSSRQAIPKFWNQAALLLNLGPVREGERTVYQELPWKVNGIGFYTMLENPLLDGGFVRLPIRDFTEMRSRPIGAEEPWFPTAQGDWILIGDLFGQVARQGVDIVQVEVPGGGIVSYKTVDFMNLQPQVISNGFRLSLTFGLDYRHRQYITDVICSTMAEDILSGLIGSYCKQEQVAVRVEFQEAGDSSLRLYIYCDFNGALAPQYDDLQRIVATLTIESCNKRGWKIPFPQLRVHMADSDKAA